MSCGGHGALVCEGSISLPLLLISDNAAGYSFWTQAANLSFWGQPEAIFRQVYAGYKALSVPVVSWEVDCNFIGETGFASGWCWRDWRTWNTSFFPSAGNLSSLLGGAPMTLYVSAFCADSVQRAEGYEFVNVSGWGNASIAVVHPDSSYAMYYSLLSHAASAWGMQQVGRWLGLFCICARSDAH